MGGCEGLLGPSSDNRDLYMKYVSLACPETSQHQYPYLFERTTDWELLLGPSDMHLKPLVLHHKHRYRCGAQFFG